MSLQACLTISARQLYSGVSCVYLGSLGGRGLGLEVEQHDVGDGRHGWNLVVSILDV